MPRTLTVAGQILVLQTCPVRVNSSEWCVQLGTTNVYKFLLFAGNKVLSCNAWNTGYKSCGMNKQPSVLSCGALAVDMCFVSGLPGAQGRSITIRSAQQLLYQACSWPGTNCDPS